MENTIGKRIAANRKRLGLTQEQLAEQLGITAQAVSKWENDQSCPDISVLPALADIFGVSTDVLLGRVQMPVQTINNDKKHSSDYSEADDDDDNNDTGDDRHIYINLENDSKGSGKLYLIGTAVLFLVVGILYLLAKLMNWECSLWDILWPCILLVYGVTGLVRRISLFWLACSGVGAFFLVNNIIPLPFDLDKGIMWAAIIILCGIALLIDALRKKQHRKIHVNGNDHTHEFRVEDGYLHGSNTFGEENQVITAKLLKGGEITNRFGEYTLDFSGVESVSDDCTIDLSCSFGEIQLKVPSYYRVVHKTTSAFADFDVKGRPDEEVRGEIFLKGSVSFGEICVKYI